MKHLIKKLLREGLKPMLVEDITSGSAIVYHRTKSDGAPVADIVKGGYRVGSGGMYGIGVYASYELESQLSTSMRSKYGEIIIESRVKSLNNFLIFDYDVAKKVYGNKNYTLDKQLKIILGGNFDINNSKLKDIISKVPTVEYTDGLALEFTKNFKNLLSSVGGLIFTSKFDGKVIVCYDRGNIEPIRYTDDETKNWNNILDKNVYKRSGGYNPEDKGNTKLAHISNKLQYDWTGKIGQYRLTEDEITYLLELYDKGNNLISKFINSLKNKGVEFLLSKIDEPQRLINILLVDKLFIKGIDSEGIGSLLEYSEDPEVSINVILDKVGENKVKELMSGISDKGSLISYSENSEKVKEILRKYEKVNKEIT